MKKYFLALATIAVLFLIMSTSCAALDVVGKRSVDAFGAMLRTIPENVTQDETGSGAWKLYAPDGSASFFWGGSGDYGAVAIQFDMRPFTDAGLDVSKLPDGYSVSENMITVGSNPQDGERATDNGSAETPLAAYERLLETRRDSVKYHAARDHHGVTAGDGNGFEWANDLLIESGSGDKQELDMVFALNPEQLIAAGVVPEMVEGWEYGTVKVMVDGRKVDVERFLKTFDLK